MVWGVYKEDPHVRTTTTSRSRCSYQNYRTSKEGSDDASISLCFTYHFNLNTTMEVKNTLPKAQGTGGYQPPVTYTITREPITGTTYTLTYYRGDKVLGVIKATGFQLSLVQDIAESYLEDFNGSGV